ncbi:Nin one binding (NOB1) Zn-ribbon like domain containing protein [Elaphomyces granulatus]
MSKGSAAPKPVHTLVLDAGPLLKNIPPLASLLIQAEELITTPSLLREIRDPHARTRVETLYLPFLKQRAPTPKSISILNEFARKTGDRAVLSTVDLEVLALAYEIECERNGGDWRLRRVPGQRGINGRPPTQEGKKQDQESPSESESAQAEQSSIEVEEAANQLETTTLEGGEMTSNEHVTGVSAETYASTQVVEFASSVTEESEYIENSDSDSEGWITPSNIKKRQARDEAISASATPESKVMQVATMTTDFACQNVLLQMNLNLLSATTLQRIRHLKAYIKRCHGCFHTTKEMDKEFCPRCGKDTLTRVSCSTDASGQFKLHLKKNMQWNTRGNIYSIPKPVHGNPSGKWKGGGGKGGWGTELILSEDQKEYTRAVLDEQRQLKKVRDLMDEDYLPSILSGDRNRPGGRIKVGAGRNVNSRKR